MHLRIAGLWSPDLLDAEAPADNSDYQVFAQVRLVCADANESQVYGFSICGPAALARVESGTFIRDTLALCSFSWHVVKTRLAKLLRHVEGCKTWREVDDALVGFLKCQDD